MVSMRTAARSGLFLSLLLMTLALVGCALPAASAQGGAAEIRNAWSPGQPDVIRVSGYGEATGRPDTTVLRLRVRGRGATAQDARDAIAAALDVVLPALEAVAGADQALTTRDFRLFPDYARPNGERVRSGFIAESSVVAVARDAEAAGVMIDAALDAGGDAVEVDGLSYRHSDPGALSAQARELAYADLVGKARQLAALSGRELGPALELSEGGRAGDFRPWYGYEAVGAEALSAAPERSLSALAAGERRVSVTLSGVFRLE